MKTIAILVLGLLGFTADNNHVSWQVKLVGKQAADAVVELEFTGKIDTKWYVYSSELQVDGPMPTKLTLETSDVYEVLGKISPNKPKEKQDEIWGGKIHYFEKTAKLCQKIKIKKTGLINGKLSGQACSNIDGMCMPFSVPFTLEVKY